MTSLSGLALCLSAASCFSDPSSGSSGGAIGSGARPTTCAILEGGAPPPTAPNGYYTNGSQVCTASGQPHIFRGVDRSSFEFNPSGVNISLSDFQAMASWNANVVRIATNQDYWLSGAALYDASYQSNIQQAVSWAEQAGLEVILDLHWSDRGNLGVDSQNTGSDTPGTGQQQMADVNSVEFWKEVATTFQNDGHVFFELYNEPNGIPWSVWLNGGMVTGTDPYTAYGMQQLYNTVRSTGANNLVIAGGLDFAFDLSGVESNPIQGYNIMYATHPYKGNDSQSQWPGSFEYLSIDNFAPVIATEFGDGSTDCTGAWDQALIAAAAQSNVHMSWTAWAWYAGGCSFPALISDWSYDPTVQGTVVQQALMAENPVPTPLNVTDAGGDGATSADGSADGSISDATIGDASGGDGGPTPGGDATADGGPTSGDDGGDSGSPLGGDASDDAGDDAD